MTVAILGGAGYIGSHAVKAFVENGDKVVVIDNLLTGHEAAVDKEAVFYQGDIKDVPFLIDVFTKEKVDAVIHFAASSLVGESMTEPLKYFDNNVYGTQCLLEAMKHCGIESIVFSSSAATYGEPERTPILETEKTEPKNPYGESKLMMEKMLRWCDEAYGIKYVALRYFNVAGASLDGSIGEDHTPETHLVPIILETALGKREKLTVFGDDYPTPDGTCIRDYVHVVDLADAHVKALDYLKQGQDSNVFNLGSSQGFSVKEMIDAAVIATGKEIPFTLGDRRQGDPATLVAGSEKAKTELGWIPRYTNLPTILSSAWEWHSAHINGYK